MRWKTRSIAVAAVAGLGAVTITTAAVAYGCGGVAAMADLEVMVRLAATPLPAMLSSATSVSPASGRVSLTGPTTTTASRVYVLAQMGVGLLVGVPGPLAPCVGWGLGGETARAVTIPAIGLGMCSRRRVSSGIGPNAWPM